MKPNKLLLLVTLTAFTLFSCSKSNEDLLVGTWNEIETGESVLHYYEDGTYKFEYDNESFETGKWRIEEKTLYTIVDNTEEELNEELTVLDETKMVVTIGEMFQTTYERAESN